MNKLNRIIEELIDLANESGSIAIEDVKVLISRAFIEGINFSEKKLFKYNRYQYKCFY